MGDCLFSEKKQCVQKPLNLLPFLTVKSKPLCQFPYALTRSPQFVTLERLIGREGRVGGVKRRNNFPHHSWLEKAGGPEGTSESVGKKGRGGLSCVSSTVPQKYFSRAAKCVISLLGSYLGKEVHT